MTGPVAALLADGRLHLQHGPIDLIVGATGKAQEIRRAYAQISAAFAGVLERLVEELPILRAPVASVRPHDADFLVLRDGPKGALLRMRKNESASHSPHPEERADSTRVSASQDDERASRRARRMPHAHGPVARRMIRAVWPHRAVFITPMAAVAGAVADEMLRAMLKGRDLQRAYVNDGGDIAIHLTEGESMRVGVAGTDLEGEPDAALDGFATIDFASPVRGIATSGRGGRSLSLGIADSATVLARDAAAADAAATLVANAVDVESPAVRRLPANQVKDDSDLGAIPVTVSVGDLSAAEIEAALDQGAREAGRLLDAGLIHGALLRLRGRRRIVPARGDGERLARRATSRHASLNCFT